jgi:GNAT superfamily N-acetyltransferase
MKHKLLIVDTPKISLEEIKSNIITDITSLNLLLRYANISDIYKIDELFCSLYSPEIAREISPYETMRTIKYGHIIIIEDINNNLIACLYSLPYYTDFKISYAMRLAVRKDFEGKNIGTKIYKFLTIKAIENGCIFQDSLVSLNNIFMHNMLLNKMGAKYTGLIEEKLPGIYHHLISRLSLSTDNLFKPISRASVTKFITIVPKEDYKLVELQDTERLVKSFISEEFEAVALIWPNWIPKKKKHMLLLTKR